MAVDDSIVEAMRAQGAPPEDIARVQAIAQQAEPEHKAFGIWRDNARTFECFHNLRTQWTFAGSMVPQRMGLNYAGVQAYLALNQPRRFHRSLMQDLQLMEIAVLQADAELRQQREDST